MTAPDSVRVWRSRYTAGDHVIYEYHDSSDAEHDTIEGVWRPLSDDQRRDRIVRAAEAFAACERDATDVASLAWANARRELMAAVAAGRETT